MRKPDLNKFNHKIAEVVLKIFLINFPRSKLTGY